MHFRPISATRYGYMVAALFLGVFFPAHAEANADDSARVNQGIYGANVYDIAYDEVHDIVWAATEGALSLFMSLDSGSTWESAYPPDSLEFERNGQTVGWGGGGRSISSDNGISVAMNAEEGGSLVSAVITPDGGENGWTIYDHAIKSDIKSQLGTALHADRDLGLTMAETHNGTVYMGSGNILLSSSDTAKTWEICAAFPDTTVIDSNIDPNSMQNFNSVIPFGNSSDTLLALVDGGVGSNMQNAYVTLDGGNTFMQFAVFDSSGMSDQFPIIDTVKIDTSEYDGMKGTVIDTIDDSIRVRIVDSTGRHCPYIEEIFVYGARSDTLLAWEKSTTINNQIQGLNALHVSFDKGEHWRRIFKEEPGTNLGHVELFEDPSFTNGARIIAGSRYSDDFGATWNDMQKVDPAQIGDVPSKIVCHIPESDIYIGTSNAGTWQSDGGINDSFALTVEGLEAVTIYDVAQDTGNLDKVVLATKSGIAITNSYTDESVPYADKWHGSHGAFPMLNNSYYVAGINPYDTAEVWAVNGNGVRYASSNALDETNWSATSDGKFGQAMGGSYNSYVTGLDFEEFTTNGGEPSSIAFYSSDTIFISLRCARSSYGGVIRSNDGGATWSMVTTLPDTVCNIIAIGPDSAGNNVIYAGFGDLNQDIPGALYRSSDGGQTWTNLKEPSNATTGDIYPVYDIALRNHRADSIMIAAGECIAYSPNYGDSMYGVMPPQYQGVDLSQPLASVDISKNDPDSVFIAQGKYVWLLDMSPEPDTGMDDACSDSCWGDSCMIICCKGDSCDTMVVDTTKEGEMENEPMLSLYHWGYPGEIIHDLHYDALTMTSSVGFYSISGNTGSLQQPPLSTRKGALRRHQNPLQVTINPNPFIAQVKIAWTLPHEADIHAGIYRLDGKLIHTIHDGPMHAGAHTVHIARERFPGATGMYIFRLQSASHNLIYRIIKLQ